MTDETDYFYRRRIMKLRLIFSRYKIINEIIFITKDVRNISFCQPQPKIRNYVIHNTHSEVKNGGSSTCTTLHTPSLPGQEQINLKYLTESSARLVSVQCRYT